MSSPSTAQKISEDVRSQQMRDFVDATPWKDAPLEALQIDASIRRFYRVRRADTQTAVLMDARPPLEDTAVFELMRDKLDKMGLTVPTIYARDHVLGLVLMEDFGDVRFYERVTKKTDEPAASTTAQANADAALKTATPSASTDSALATADAASDDPDEDLDDDIDEAADAGGEEAEIM